MNSKLLCATFTFGILVSVVPFASSPTAAGAQLVHMSNGRTIRVETVEREDMWLLVKLQGGHTVGVLASTVDRVEEDLFPDSEALGSGLNVVTSGRFIPRGGRFRSSRSSRRTAPAPSQQQARTDSQKEPTKPGVRSDGKTPAQGHQKGAARRPPSNDQRRGNR
jgi:hypothetical protein